MYFLCGIDILNHINFNPAAERFFGCIIHTGTS